MCKINDYIGGVAHYFSSMLGDNVAFRPAKKELLERLPIGVSSNFIFYQGNLLGHGVLLACLEDGDSISPYHMQKQLGVVRRLIGMDVILAAVKVASYNVQRWIGQKINFVIPQKQMFIPSLMIELNKARQVGADLKEKIPPFAQLLLLYHLQVSSIEGSNSDSIMEKFVVSYATVNRALRWLEVHGLVKFEGKKSREIHIPYLKKELWNKALPMFCSPVDKILFTDSMVEEGLESGINALSSYTMMNSESQSCFALSKEDVKLLGCVFDKQFGKSKIQIWRYNPRLLSSSGVVDKLSLYLSLRDNPDERVQIELERLISEMKW